MKNVYFEINNFNNQAITTIYIIIIYYELNESDEVCNQERKNLMKIVVDTDDDYPEYDNSSENSSILSIDSSSNYMDVDEVSQNHEDIEDQNLIFYDRQEKNDRQNYINMFKDKHSYPNANSIADSKILSWKRTKINVVYEHYSLYREFLEDKRKSRSPSKN